MATEHFDKKGLLIGSYHKHVRYGRVVLASFLCFFKERTVS